MHVPNRTVRVWNGTVPVPNRTVRVWNGTVSVPSRTVPVPNRAVRVWNGAMRVRFRGCQAGSSRSCAALPGKSARHDDRLARAGGHGYPAGGEPAEVRMSAFVIGIPAPQGLDSKVYRVRVVVDRRDGTPLTEEDLARIEAVYPSKLGGRRTRPAETTAATKAKPPRKSSRAA